MILPEIVVGYENWKCDDVNTLPDVAAGETPMHHVTKNTVLSVKKWTVIFYQNWLDRV